VAERLVEYARNELRYGYPDDDATNFGPVVSVDLDGAVR
jgi:aminomuconate-semialdehyde/2-hydroxymuconate-6-semialdehyde dehydrogenase